mgnify:CR=1 FL=1
MAEATEKKTQTILVSAGNLDMNYVISGVEYEVLFKALSDGGSKNQATFEIKGYKQNFTINGITLGQLLTGFALSEARIKHASKVRRMTAAEAKASNGKSTELAELILRAARAEIDPIQAGFKAYGKMTPEQQSQFMIDLQKMASDAIAKQAGNVE